MEAIVLLLFFGAGLAAYFAPSIIALARHHHNVGTIVVINLLLGWTFIGWVVALAMSAGSVRPAYDPYGQVPGYYQLPTNVRPPSQLPAGQNWPAPRS